MPRQIQIVQFTHPGGEHSLNKTEKKSGIKEWNYGKHKRKFLKSQGQYVLSSGVLSSKQDLLFWGEWEPTSKVTCLLSMSATGVMPHYLHEPFLRINGGKLLLPPSLDSSSRCRQNTDPFVFGDYFLYSCCKQRKKARNSSSTCFTQMANLDKGSIILFGSTISPKLGGPYFVLDTVFVVGDYKPFNTQSCDVDLMGFVPTDYCDIMGFPNWKNNEQYICYKGATVDNPVDGMYSFVPCKPVSGNVIGHPRVKLTDSDISIISNNLNSSPKYTSFILHKDCWSIICKIVKQQGFEKGVNLGYQYLP